MIVTRILSSSMILSAVEPEAAHAQIMAAKQDGTITTASIYALLAVTATLVSIVGGVWMILRSIRQDREKAEEAGQIARAKAQKDADERTEKITSKIDDNQRSTDDRLKAVEVRMERFVPGDVIEQKLEHLKTNRIQVEVRQAEQLKELDRNVHSLCTQVAKLEERGESMAAGQVEIKDVLKELRADMKAGFEKLSRAA